MGTMEQCDICGNPITAALEPKFETPIGVIRVYLSIFTPNTPGQQSRYDKMPYDFKICLDCVIKNLQGLV